MTLQAFFLGGSIDKVGPAVSAICFNQQGDLLLAGYTNGTVSLWDVTRRTVAKTISGEHNAAIVHTLFLGQESGAGRHLKAITGDCRGLVLLHTFTVVPFVRRFSVTTQVCIDTSSILTSLLLLNCSFSFSTSQSVCHFRIAFLVGTYTVDMVAVSAGRTAHRHSAISVTLATG